MRPAVCLTGVTVRYPGSQENALYGVNLRIKSGEVVLVTGRSGCGKSTLTGLVNGLVPHLYPAEIKGQVDVHGLCPADQELHQMGRLVSTVFQNPRTQFFCADSTAEMAFASENAGLHPELIRKRISSVTGRLSMTALLGRPMSQLSGGQKQQVAIAAAAVNEPHLYVLDEPTSNLDHAGVRAVERLLYQLRSTGATVLITEHRLGFLRGLVDRVLILDRGQIVMDLTADDFFSMPDNRRRALGLRRLIEPTKPTLTAMQSTNREPGEICQADSAGLEVKGVSFRYRRRLTPALTVERLSIPRGRVTIIEGANGAGKSTLVQVLSGLARPYRGSIRLDGEVIDRRSLLARSHVVMQDVNRQLFSDTVGRELVTGSGCDDPDRVLTNLGLAGLSDRHPMALSGGQRQRLAVATAVAANADLVYFDEPTSGLDHDGMLAIAHLLQQLAADGRVVVVVTHDHELAAECGDLVVELAP